DRWQHVMAITMVGSRDLSRYGDYADHFVDRNQFPTPEQIGDEQKDQKAPTFFTVDTSLTYRLRQHYSLVFGINNLFDYTQTGSANDSPTAWHWHFDHAHFDSLHTWGPNRGREFFFKFAADW
ncbi:MAG: TonB-dependent receptor, partial [Bdellovibrionales bacterium]|nr:TonB-dependent receptor [Bdellovibrionales bacterium]